MRLNPNNFAATVFLTLWCTTAKTTFLRSSNNTSVGNSLLLICVGISSAYNEFVKYYEKAHPNTTQAKQDEYDRTILSSYRSKDKISAAFFPSLVGRNLRYPGIKCYHSTLKTAESENWNKLYSNIFEEQCTFPETKVFRKK
ncbi:Uncharacterised protein [Legionella busanensis]|uniref:Uncharacterized protein n=1 Tax=Legionella busanensis TaxID=190655 RepID=A0A378K909_9GAMM|nr:hypothetical protein [Legionella busanensis]STX81206.1 Uncharacterised protein [Legionella busanensis]